MFGGLVEFNTLDWIMLGLALLTTTIAIVKENPHEPGSPEHLALRLSRTSIALAYWSYGFGLIGMGIALVSFVLAIVTMTKGLVSHGIQALIILIVVKTLGFMDSMFSPLL